MHAVGLFSVSILLFRLSHCFIVVSSALSEARPHPSVRTSNSLSPLSLSLSHSLTHSLSDSMVNKITGPTNMAGAAAGICKRKSEKVEKRRGAKRKTLSASPAFNRV